MEPLIHLNYPIDKEQLLKEANEAKKFSEAYGNDPRWPNQTLDTWLISRYSSPYILKIIEDFEIDGKPRFYWLEANAMLPVHVDNETTCSINFVLSDDPAPITINGENYMYSNALLNTCVPHSVSNGPYERILFKISIFNESYEELAKRIKYKL